MYVYRSKVIYEESRKSLLSYKPIVIAYWIDFRVILWIFPVYNFNESCIARTARSFIEVHTKGYPWTKADSCLARILLNCDNAYITWICASVYFTPRVVKVNKPNSMNSRDRFFAAAEHCKRERHHAMHAIILQTHFLGGSHLYGVLKMGHSGGYFVLIYVIKMEICPRKRASFSTIKAAQPKLSTIGL